jgi:hypothetical protein
MPVLLKIPAGRRLARVDFFSVLLNVRCSITHRLGASVADSKGDDALNGYI